MATRRTTYGKNERERAKKAKAAAKRERRLEATAEAAAGSEHDEHPGSPDGESVAELFAEIDRLHRRFDAHEIGHPEFEQRKGELLARLPID
jgi:hypothetical protein